MRREIGSGHGVTIEAAANLQPNGPADYFYQAVSAGGGASRGNECFQLFSQCHLDEPEISGRLDIYLEANWRPQEKLRKRRRSFPKWSASARTLRAAHLNYGVALAKLGKLDEALKEFQITLQLNPTNTVAQQNLETIQANMQAQKTRGQP